MWKFCGKANHPKLCGNCAFEQNFHTQKLGETTLFFVVYSSICFPLRRVTKKIELVLYFSKWIVSLLGTNHSQTWLISVSSIYQIHPELMHDDISFTYIRHYKRSTINPWGTRRNSHRRCSVKKGVLRNFAKFTGKHLCQTLVLNNLAGLRPQENSAKFLRTSF